MQRAAAASPLPLPLPVPQPQSQNPEIPPLKRQKISNNPTSSVAPISDPQTIQRPPDEEDHKRERAIQRLGEEAGETTWVLNTVDAHSEKHTPVLRVTTTGYSDIDGEISKPNQFGRRSFGKFNQELEVGFLFSIFNRAIHIADQILQGLHRTS